MTGRELLDMLKECPDATLEHPVVFEDGSALVTLRRVTLRGLNERGRLLPPDEAMAVLGPKDRAGYQRYGTVVLVCEGETWVEHWRGGEF